ncbi:MAG TPA: hypothetical protein VM802_30560 [Chitinophaga sp.]|uniref:hypothetical protein n=1 Tax=Chitinophaga sp. TaxID=1869181 RepID=UPI002C4B69F7|nr:hypothetical protein [Chitinophaga sp.]HVI49247.1 hypothetical protein [Chitinophaga sp.]
MKHIRFQHDVKEGGIEVQFDLDYDGQKPIVRNISIHSSFNPELQLPIHPELVQHEGKWRFKSTFKTKDENGNMTDKYEYTSGKLADDLIELILAKVNEEIPHF